MGKKIIVDAEAWIDARAKELYEDDEVLKDWVDDRYTAFEVFDMDEREKAKAKNDFMEYCKEIALEEFDDNFEEYDVDELD